ncbi:MAG: TIGR00645 family protein [Rhizomicrobium sp.]
MAGKSFEEIFEQSLFRSRWLMAPFYVGLIIALLVLMITFGKEVVEETSKVISLELEENTVVLWLLTLIDMSLAGNLTLMVVFAGYENFVSKLDLEGNPDKPVWMGKVDFSNMKLKLIASIIAISVIHLLKSFMSIEVVDKGNLQWLMMLHGVFLVSGLVLAAMDYLGEKGAENDDIEEEEGEAEAHITDPAAAQPIDSRHGVGLRGRRRFFSKDGLPAARPVRRPHPRG